MNQNAGAILRRKVGAIQTRGYSFPIQSELAAKLEYAAAKGASSALHVTTEAIVEHSSVGRLNTLPERCGIPAAGDLAAAGLALAPGAGMRIDAGAVARMSCATVVALISLARTATEAGGEVIIRAPTGAFTDAFADLGLFESLMNMRFAE